MIRFLLVLVSIISCSPLHAQKLLVAEGFSSNKMTDTAGLPAQEYQAMTFNGAWCWFSDPRAVYYEGQFRRTYSGWVDDFGDLHVAYYDHDTGLTHSKLLFDQLEYDDHDNPSLLFDEEGRLQVYFNRHVMGVQPLFLTRATVPESIENWGPIQELHLNDPGLASRGSMNHTYTNPIKLASENGRIYLFWRGVDGKPSYSYTDDNGTTFSTGKVLFMPDPIYSFRRPYTKIYSDGKSRIHFTFTDGHPRKEKGNSIYYFYYENGEFRRANGSKIKDITAGPVTPSEADLVYNANKTGQRAWNWDIAQDEAGHPVIGYVRFPDSLHHVYSYARFDGARWNNHQLIDAGRWFPETQPGKVEIEPHYSGGMSIDHEDVNTVYLSVNRTGTFEIERWDTKDQGKHWAITSITRNSRGNNVRPFAVRGAQAEDSLQVLWMHNAKYTFYFEGFDSAIRTNLPLRTIDPSTPEGVIEVMRRAADARLTRINNRNRSYAELEVFHAGLAALTELTGEAQYRDEALNMRLLLDTIPSLPVPILPTETSGNGFASRAFYLAYGINRGFIAAAKTEQVLKDWKTVVSQAQETDWYRSFPPEYSGWLLLAGKEVHTLLLGRR